VVLLHSHNFQILLMTSFSFSFLELVIFFLLANLFRSCSFQVRVVHLSIVAFCGKNWSSFFLSQAKNFARS